jgi:hypothetical protein
MDEQKPSFKCNSPLEKEMMLALKSLFSGYVPEYYQQLAKEFVDIAKYYGATESGEPAAALSQPSAQGAPDHSAGGECGDPIFKHRLRSVLEIVQRYLPPDGISAKTAMSKITALVDPWPWPLYVMPPEWEHGESFIGQAEQADFEDDTWTFKMQHPYIVGAGFYRISYIGLTAQNATPNQQTGAGLAQIER